jgi:hypothetical protein
MVRRISRPRVHTPVRSSLCSSALESANSTQAQSYRRGLLLPSPADRRRQTSGGRAFALRSTVPATLGLPIQKRTDRWHEHPTCSLCRSGAAASRSSLLYRSCQGPPRRTAHRRNSALDHLRDDLGFGDNSDGIGDLSGGPALGLARPVLRQIQLAIAKGAAPVRHAGCKHAALTISDFARRSCVLAPIPLECTPCLRIPVPSITSTAPGEARVSSGY